MDFVSLVAELQQSVFNVVVTLVVVICVVLALHSIVANRRK
jgi:hypothetical protein